MLRSSRLGMVHMHGETRAINTHKAHVKNAQFATAEYLIPKPMKVMMMPVK
jgi:hypothetical protein